MLASGLNWPLVFTVVIGMSEASQALHSGGYYANYLDLSREYAGLLSGTL